MPKRIQPFFIVLAIISGGYAATSAVLGVVIAYQRAGLSETINVLDDPEKFWGVVLMYAAIAFVSAILGVKSYFHPRIQEFLNFGMKTKLSRVQVIFILSFAFAVFMSITLMSGVLANA
ncbi:hypothetical protein ACJJI4_06800 [Microbulbifer sp. TRSA002]|uniref:hypothetical protein n=1 Tax=Microbulbifer sp. TRSA002 TaxID=3243382 RepID=UPI004039E5AF